MKSLCENTMETQTVKQETLLSSPLYTFSASHEYRVSLLKAEFRQLTVSVKSDFISESFQIKFSMYNSFSLQFDDWML